MFPKSKNVKSKIRKIVTLFNVTVVIAKEIVKLPLISTIGLFSLHHSA